MDALRSVVLINATPFDSRGMLAEDDYARVLDHAVTAGIGAVTPNGNTSEFYSLVPDEIDRALTITVDTVKGRAAVIAGVGHELDRAVRMAQSARDAGADAIMVHQPVHPYLTEEGWVSYHKAIADAVPTLKVVCYLRSPHIGGAAVRKLAVTCPNVAGVKYAVPDVLAFADMLAETGFGGAERLVWVCGLAESWAPRASPPAWPAWPRNCPCGCSTNSTPATPARRCGSGAASGPSRTSAPATATRTTSPR
jgi:4-hydroxy-tetrahydrodipicolinate synthase